MIDEKVKKYCEGLKKLGIEYQVLEHPQLISVEEVQKYLGYIMEDSAATLVMKADDHFVAIIRRGDTKLDSEEVKKHLKITSLRMATEEEFEKITGVPSGAASVYIKNLPTYIDEKIFEKEYINAGSGSLLVTIRYKTDDLKKIPGIKIVNFTSIEEIVVKSVDYPKFMETVKALKDKKIPHELIKHKPIKTVEEGLAFLGIKPDQGVSTLIFKTEKGLGAVLRRDDHQIDLEKIKKIFSAETISLCNPSEVFKATGCEIGYVSAYNQGFEMVIDKTILEKDFVFLGTGSPEYDLKIRPKDLVTLTNAKAMDVVGKGVIREKSRILSGITPSGDGTLHIGNYLGAVKQFVEFAKSYDCFLFIADLHALPTIQNRQQLQKNTEALILNELALLGDLKNITFFRQSDVPLHAELQTILNNYTPLGLLRRAHAYKDKLSKDVMEDEINLGLFNYPILMAADILLYKPDFVPVGKDQKQHIEICRDIAERFNKIYPSTSLGTGKTQVLKLPQPYIPEEVAVIMGTDGKRKMAKSLGNVISIFEDEEVIRKQVMGTYTDPTRIRVTDPGHIEGNMVFVYLDFFGDKSSVEELKKLYREGKVADVEVKNYLFKSLMKAFKESRARYQELKSNPQMVKEILKNGAEKAKKVASQTMKEVREVIGLSNQYSFFRYS